jgi:hypothetical protein
MIKLAKDVPAARNNYWRPCFLCGPSRIEENRRLAIPKTSSFLIINTSLELPSASAINIKRQ